LRVAGAYPDVTFLVAAAAGYVAGPSRGIVVGFAAGVVADLFVPTPFGMSALVGALIAYFVAIATKSLVRSSPALQIVSGAAATAAGLCAFAILGAVLGYPKMLDLQLAPALVISTPFAALLAVPATRLLDWAVGPKSDKKTGALAW
jgi:rod shape-determining protein MreD